jgi:cell shape-determining protein MreC
VIHANPPFIRGFFIPFSWVVHLPCRRRYFKEKFFMAEENPQVQQLLEENAMLKKKVKELEEENAKLKSSKKVTAVVI